MASSPADLVTTAFANATSYASHAQSQATGFITALNAAVYAVPTISVTWASIAAPAALAMPAEPDFDDIVFNTPSDMPSSLALATPTITIDDFTESAPTVDFGDAPALNFPTAPTISYGTVPTVPSVADVTVPDAPTVAAVALPTLLTLSTPAFGGIDLHASFLDPLSSPPDLGLIAPTPFSYTRGQEYASTLLDAVKAKLKDRLDGGTGLPAAVEAAIWDRARVRELAAADANRRQVMLQADAEGFMIPSGATTARYREADQNYWDKVSELSRDIAIKQADLEQTNLREAIVQGIDLEGKLIDYAMRLETLAFETASKVADNAVQIYNSQVENFRALLEKYRAYAEAYRVIIEGERLKVETYRAELQAEQTKAEVNRTLVEQYRAQIEAGMTVVRLYEAQLSGAKALMELEQAKVAAAGEQIRAYVAGINGETAKVEAYKAGVQAEGTKADAYATNVRAKLGIIEVYKTKAEAFQAKAGAQGEKARALVSVFEGTVRAKQSEWEAWAERVRAEQARVGAIATKTTALTDKYRAQISAVTAQADQNMGLFSAQVKQYEAQQNYILQAQKINTAVLESNRAVLADAAKVGAQTFSQLAASAYSIIHANTSTAGTAGTSVSYSYGGQVNADVSPVAAI